MPSCLVSASRCCRDQGGDLVVEVKANAPRRVHCLTSQGGFPLSLRISQIPIQWARDAFKLVHFALTKLRAPAVVSGAYAFFG